MLHVRVVSPPEMTERLVGSLAADSGVVNLVVMRGAAARGDGDSVQFDVLTGSANQVPRRLREFDLDRDSSVVIQNVDAAIMDRARQAARQRSYHGERAPVWELVEARIREGAEYAPSFFLLLVFAGVIGACGILTNSQILIVGAAFGAWGEAGGSAAQLVLNVGLLIAVGALGLRMQRLIWRRWAERRSPIRGPG